MAPSLNVVVLWINITLKLMLVSESVDCISQSLVESSGKKKKIIIWSQNRCSAQPHQGGVQKNSARRARNPQDESLNVASSVLRKASRLCCHSITHVFVHPCVAECLFPISHRISPLKICTFPAWFKYSSLCRWIEGDAAAKRATTPHLCYSSICTLFIAFYDI